VDVVFCHQGLDFAKSGFAFLAVVAVLHMSFGFLLSENSFGAFDRVGCTPTIKYFHHPSEGWICAVSH
jgi:hypothetical protein